MALMGGRGSCGQDAQGNQSPFAMSNYPQFRSMIDSLISRGTVVNFLVSCYQGSNVIKQITSDAPASIVSGDIETTKRKVASMVAALLPAQTFLMGHSYGGWLAMKTALALGQGAAVAGLFTIDPISPVTCTFTRPEGCTAAPSDVTGAQRDLLAAQTGNWTNFYQTSTFYLHSSVINQADENQHIDAEHTAIDTDRQVWNTIGAEIN